MNEIDAAGVHLAREYARSCGEDLTPREADAALNEASRGLVRAVQAAHGVAWLGRLNRQPHQRGLPSLWRWDGSELERFAADLVLPAHDAELERLIEARQAAPYTGTAADIDRMRGIAARCKDVGAKALIWS